MKKITIADVAKHSNVSKSTVSQYLNGRFDYMGDETKLRIEQAIEVLDFRPNILARSLRQKSTSTIGVIVANILHSFSTQVIRAIEDTCNKDDYHVIVCNADDDPEKEKRYIEMLRAKQVDGIIIFPTGGNIELYQEMSRVKFPLVFVDRKVNDVQVPSIVLDNELASRMAVQHFIDKGYRRIGMMTTTIIRNLSPRIERISGYKYTLEENGIPIVDEYIKSTELKHLQSGLEEMLSLEKPPQAILAGNDLALVEILKYVKQNHLKVPSDLALIGIDETSFASFYNPGLTTIAQPTIEMGEKAAGLLLDKIQKKETDEMLIYSFQPKLTIRESL